VTVRMEERGRLVRRATDSSVDRAVVELAMRRALDLSRATFPHPNPRVGAVILDPMGEVCAAGTHAGPGSHHAERAAIAEKSFPHHTMVVTLEPCDHTGRTPPCTEAILDAGIDTVVVGALDPDTRVAGRGVERLRRAGITVHTGVLADQVEASDAAYFFHRRNGRAMITLKMASTLDGQVAAADGTSQWITGEQARRDVHQLRAAHDAVMVGSGTVIADRPSLTVRLDGYQGPQPRPVIVAGRRALPPDAPSMMRDPLVYGSPDGADLHGIATDLPNHGILGVLVEGGPTLAGALFDEGLVDRLAWYVGGMVAGGLGVPAFPGVFATLGDARRIMIDDIRMVGADIRIDARPEVV
jgi:diaminohydroxyphosphoribosylaminopyrimidine deaminase / 5-amino-6-(5-phosphoribosylamino)uracil reductase